MKKLLTTTIAAAAMTLSAGTMAEEPDFNYLELGYDTTDYNINTRGIDGTQRHFQPARQLRLRTAE